MLSTFYTMLGAMLVCQVLLIGLTIVFFALKWIPLGVLFAVIVIVSMPVHTLWGDTREQYQFVQTHKPTCDVESVNCLEQRLQWLKDSAYVEQAYMSTQVSTKERLDSLKAEISKYGH